MPILTGDILQNLSTDAGSTGGVIAGSSVISGIMNNVWPDISDGDRIAGGEVFRKTFWKNNSGSDPMLSPIMWAPSLPAGMVLSLGLGFDEAADGDAEQGNMLPFTGSASCVLISDSPADFRSVTIWGVDDTGVPVSESLDLVGDIEVPSATLFAKVWAVLTTVNALQTIEIREGPGGGARGQIGPNKVCCWLWVVEPDAKISGIALPDLAAGDNYGMWRRLAWQPDAAPARPNTLTVTIEEA